MVLRGGLIILVGFTSICFAADSPEFHQKKLKILKAYRDAKPSKAKSDQQALDPKTLSTMQADLDDQIKSTCFEILKSPGEYDSATVSECKKREKEIKKKVGQTRRAILQCYISLPFPQEGCEGECCGIPTDQLQAENSQKLYEKPTLQAKVIGKIEKDEALEAADLLLLTTQLGEVKVVQENYKVLSLGLKKGDVLKTLSYNSEGSYIVCLGSSQNDDLGWEGELTSIKDAKVEQWTKVTTKGGLSGYANGIAYRHRGGC